MANRESIVYHQPIVESVAGAHTLVAALADHQILVIGLYLSAAGTVQCTLQDTSTSLADLHLVAGSGHSWPINELGWIRTSTNEALSILLGGGVAVGGTLVYRYIPEHLEA